MQSKYGAVVTACGMDDCRVSFLSGAKIFLFNTVFIQLLTQLTVCYALGSTLLNLMPKLRMCGAIPAYIFMT